MPLDRDQPADAEHARLVGRRLRLASGDDPVVDDRELGLVEALDLGEVAREPARDRDVEVREAGDRPVREREAGVLAELVEAVLRAHAERHRGHRAGDLPVDVGVDEVRVQDQRPRAREVRGDARERERVDVGAQTDHVDGNASRAKLVGELERTGLVLVQLQEADVPVALSEPRQEREQVRLRTRDARDLREVEDRRSHRVSSRMPFAHDSTECSRATVACRVRPSAARSSAERSANAAIRAASSAGSSRGKAQLVGKQRVEHRVRREHGNAARRRLVDDLVRRTGAHVVHEQVVRREELGHLRTVDRPLQLRPVSEPELVPQRQELAAVLPLQLGERRAVDGQPDVEPAVERAAKRAQDDVEPLRRRVAPEREQPEVVARRMVAARELREVDPVADRVHLRRVEREGAAVDARHRRRDRRGGSERRARTPVREPEDERNPERPDERRAEHRVDRAHVRDDADGPRAELARERRLEAQAAADLATVAEQPHARVRRERPVRRAVGEHDELVHVRRERADHRHRRSERVVRRVDLLRDEDELPHQK